MTFIEKTTMQDSSVVSDSAAVADGLVKNPVLPNLRQVGGCARAPTEVIDGELSQCCRHPGQWRNEPFEESTKEHY